jgi:hypothetical protein
VRTQTFVKLRRADLNVLENQHHVLDVSKDIASLLALLFLIILQDVFNLEMYKDDGERHPIKVLYACHLKGMAWDFVDFLSTQYTWQVDFGAEFFSLLGEQLGYLSALREHYVKLELFGEQDQAPVAKQKQIARAKTKIMQEELSRVASHDDKIKIKKPQSLDYFSPLFNIDWKTWSTTRRERAKRHPYRTDEDLISLGACERDRNELERLTSIPPPQSHSNIEAAYDVS